MPFRERFDCLWCGRHHEVRSHDDLEGFASLCPECVGRADENGFLRARLRAGLQERAAASSSAGARIVAAAGAPGVEAAGTPGSEAERRVAVAPPAVATTPSAARTPAHDDWYLRRGRFSRGPLIDGPWQMELDQATSWLDGLPLSGVIVELAAGAGWWSTLLASKGELWAFEADEAALDQARRRLLAHGLMAHLHRRDPLAPPDRQVDVVFGACLLAGAPDAAGLRERLSTVHGWLKAAGTFAFVEPRPEALGGSPQAIEGPTGPLWPRAPGELGDALLEAGLEPAELTDTRTAFVMGRATALPSVGRVGP